MKRDSKYLGLKVPSRLMERLEAVAERESNGLSATVRRLLTAALTDEEASQITERRAS